MKTNPDLEAAYALSSVDGIKKLYANWALSYDTGFVDGQGYQLPRVVAMAFIAAGGRGPLLDVGAGTGLVAEHLQKLAITPIDALDLSDDMLGVAGTKGVYRNLIAADVTQPIAVSASYHGVVSAGTFTHGHVGPDAIANLLDIAAHGAVFALSVNVEHYEKVGFGAALDRIGDRIVARTAQDVRIYDDRAARDRRADMARIVTFKKV